jgi:hypothetical protein
MTSPEHKLHDIHNCNTITQLQYDYPELEKTLSLEKLMANMPAKK